MSECPACGHSAPWSDFATGRCPSCETRLRRLFDVASSQEVAR